MAVAELAKGGLPPSLPLSAPATPSRARSSRSRLRATRSRPARPPAPTFASICPATASTAEVSWSSSEEIQDLWRHDLVAFLLGCSLTFKHALIEAGVGVRNVERGTL